MINLKKIKKRLGLGFWVFSFVAVLGGAPGPGLAEIPPGNFKKEGIVSRDVDSFYDPKIDYSFFIGRVSDRGEDGYVYKVRVENNNTKFLRVGDLVEFSAERADRQDEYPCKAFVRDSEDNYFTIYVKNLSTCLRQGRRYLIIGRKLRFYSQRLQERILAGSEYRKLLLAKKEDFMVQLNRINNFLHQFNTEKVRLALQFDERIEATQKNKLLALERFTEKRRESIILQRELIKELDKLDKDLGRYRVERVELFFDRFQKDRDTGLPMGNRPPEKRFISPGQYLKLDEG